MPLEHSIESLTNGSHEPNDTTNTLGTYQNNQTYYQGETFHLRDKFVTL